MKKNKILLIILLFPLLISAAQRIHVDSNKQTAISSLDQLNRSYNFLLYTKVVLPDGRERYKLIQTYKNIIVWDTSLTSFKKNFRNLQLSDNFSGTFLTEIEYDISSITPALSEDDALKIAIPDYSNDNKKIRNLDIKLIIKEYSGTAKLGYLINYLIEEPGPTRPFFIIDANDGAVLEQWEGLPNRPPCK